MLPGLARPTSPKVRENQYWFFRTFDEDDCSPVRNDREFPEERGPLARSWSLDHQERGRTDKWHSFFQDIWHACRRR